MSAISGWPRIQKAPWQVDQPRHQLWFPKWLFSVGGVGKGMALAKRLPCPNWRGPPGLTKTLQTPVNTAGAAHQGLCTPGPPAGSPGHGVVSGLQSPVARGSDVLSRTPHPGATLATPPCSLRAARRVRSGGCRRPSPGKGSGRPTQAPLAAPGPLSVLREPIWVLLALSWADLTCADQERTRCLFCPRSPSPLLLRAGQDVSSEVDRDQSGCLGCRRGHLASLRAVPRPVTLMVVGRHLVAAFR